MNIQLTYGYIFLNNGNSNTNDDKIENGMINDVLDSNSNQDMDLDM